MPHHDTTESPTDLLAPERLRRRILDLDAWRLLLRLRVARLIWPRQVPLRTIRRVWQLTVKAFATREPIAAVEDRCVEQSDHKVRLRIYRPHANSRVPRPAVLWIHGGGFVAGDLYTAGATCRALANRSGCVFVAVDYRLAPEASLLEALDDCVAAYRWLAREAVALDLDPRRLVVAGDSAGGTLSALVAQACCQPAGHAPLAQLLVYPSTDIAARHTPQDQEWRTLLTRDVLAQCRAWVARRTNLQDPQLSPLRVADPSQLPPTLLVTAGYDPLRDEALAYGRVLRDHGVPVRVLHYPGQFHGFLCFDAVSANAHEALALIGASLKSLCATGRIEAGIATLGRPFPVADGLRGMGLVQRWREWVAFWLFLRDGAFSAAEPRQLPVVVPGKPSTLANPGVDRPFGVSPFGACATTVSM